MYGSLLLDEQRRSELCFVVLDFLIATPQTSCNVGTQSIVRLMQAYHE
jgi:hypothetical protein